MPDNKSFMNSPLFLPIVMAGSLIVSAALPILMKAIPSWKQRYDEWSSASSQKLNLNSSLHDKLKKALSDVKGQDKALSSIVSSICGWSESKNNKLDSGSGGLVIHMAGVSGTGKSMTANILTNQLSKESALRISYSSIDTTDKRSCAEQLFGSYTKKSSFNTDVKCNTWYAAQLLHNPEVVVQIDEFDKFMMRDDSLQAMLWDVADTGRLRIDKDTYIDCSRTIFILTSNASKESLKIKFDKTKNKDDSDSLESVNFKQAFLNRITSVYFENFTEDLYKEILLQKLKPIKDYYSKNYGIKIEFSDDTLSKISKELFGMKTGGARNIGIFTRKIYTALNSFRRENSISELSNEERSSKLSGKFKYNLNIFYKDGAFEIIKK